MSTSVACFDSDDVASYTRGGAILQAQPQYIERNHQIPKACPTRRLQKVRTQTSATIRSALECAMKLVKFMNYVSVRLCLLVVGSSRPFVWVRASWYYLVPQILNAERRNCVLRASYMERMEAISWLTSGARDRIIICSLGWAREASKPSNHRKATIMLIFGMGLHVGGGRCCARRHCTVAEPASSQVLVFTCSAHVAYERKATA